MATTSPVGAYTVSLTGAGFGSAVLTASATSLAFGTVNVGQTPTQTINLCAGTTVGSNFCNTPGSLSVNISGVQSSDSTDFPISTNCIIVLAPGQTCVITATFIPSAVTTYSTNITITSNAFPSTITIPVTGTGATPTLPTLTSIGPITPAAPTITPQASQQFGCIETFSDSSTVGCPIPSIDWLTTAGSNLTPVVNPSSGDCGTSALSAQPCAALNVAQGDLIGALVYGSSTSVTLGIKDNAVVPDSFTCMGKLIGQAQQILCYAFANATGSLIISGTQTGSTTIGLIQF